MNTRTATLCVIATLAAAARTESVQAAGPLVAWVHHGFRRNGLPSGKFTAVAAGRYHSLEIRGDGTLVGWGFGGDGRINVPAGIFTLVAAVAVRVEWRGGL